MTQLYQSLSPLDCPDHAFYLNFKPLTKYHEMFVLQSNKLRTKTPQQVCIVVQGCWNRWTQDQPYSLSHHCNPMLFCHDVDEQLITERTGHTSFIDGVCNDKKHVFSNSKELLSSLREKMRENANTDQPKPPEPLVFHVCSSLYIIICLSAGL